MDLDFVTKSLGSCLEQPVEILRLFDYLNNIIPAASSSQQRMFAAFTNKWKLRLHQKSKTMMIVNYKSAWPPCSKRVELGKQDPWNTFIQKTYNPTFSGCTVNSEDKPEYQPLNFNELVQLTFWKEVYETFGHLIVSHIFNKCAVLFEIDEGMYLIVAYSGSGGVMYPKIKQYKGKGAVLDNRITLPQFKSSNPYKLPEVKTKPPNVEKDAVVQVLENDISDELLQLCNREEIGVYENSQKVEAPTSENQQTYDEPPTKRLKTEKDHNGVLQKIQNRWISPKPKELEKLIEHRKNFFNIAKSTESLGSNECRLNYILIQKDEDFEPSDKIAVMKQCCPIRVASPRLPNGWQGLKLPEDLKDIAGNDKNVIFTVYKIAETLALKLGFRIKPKKRCRKHKHVPVVLEEGLESQDVHDCTGNDKPALFVPLPLVPVNSKGINVSNKEQVQVLKVGRSEVGADLYISEITLPIISCLYNKSAWTKWPPLHGLSTAAAVLPDNKQAVEKFLQNIVKSKTCSSRDHDRLVNLLEEQLHQENGLAFKRLMLQIIQTHKRITDIHKLVKNCLTSWRIKYFEKQQRRAGRQKQKEVRDKINANSGIEKNERKMLKSKSQPQPEIIDLTNLTSTPSTNFSLSDNITVIRESPQEPEVMEVDILPQTPQIIVGSSSKSLNRTRVSRATNRTTIKSRKGTTTAKLKKASMPINGLKNDIPHNCVMQTLKSVFRIMKIDSFLGSQRNKRGFFKFVRKAVILGGMKSSLQLGQLMASLHVEDMPVASICGNDRNASGVFASKLAAWLFNEYVLVILRTSFYITECSASRLQLQFYLKETWIKACIKTKMQLLQKRALKPLKDDAAVGKANALLRYIPKPNQTLRPLLIVKKAERKLSKADIDTFKVMLHYIDAKINKFRMYIPTTILRVWKNFVSEWKDMGCPKLYYFRTDIRDAYPSVQISRLKQILLEAGGEKRHRMVVKTFLLLGGGGRKLEERSSILDTHCRKMWYSGIHSRPCLVMDLERDRENAWLILERVIDVLGQSNVVKLGRKFYEFSHGLPQGWGPSSILCSIYYGYMDSTMYLPYIESSGRLFLRIVDDYLYITPNPTEISNLNQLMKFGCDKYEIGLNQEKSESNMYVRSNVSVPSRSCDTVTFCGWNFCLTCAHVSRDYKKYNGQDLCSTVAFSLSKDNESPEHFIRNRGTMIIPARLKAIVIDSTINCYKRILLTAFEASAFLSFRFYAMCRVVYPTLTAIKEPERAKSITTSIKICCGRLAGYIQTYVSRSASYEVKACTGNCCGGQEIPNQFKPTSTSESRKLKTADDDDDDPSSSFCLTHDCLMFVALHGFRITLHKHRQVFSAVTPQINKTISGLQIKMGNDKAATLLSVINGGKIPQCFDGINIKI